MKLKEGLKTVTNNRVYNIILLNIYDLEEKRCWCYKRRNPYHSWKKNRKTHWKE